MMRLHGKWGQVQPWYVIIYNKKLSFNLMSISVLILYLSINIVKWLKRKTCIHESIPLEVRVLPHK